MSTKQQRQALDLVRTIEALRRDLLRLAPSPARAPAAWTTAFALADLIREQATAEPDGPDWFIVGGLLAQLLPAMQGLLPVQGEPARIDDWLPPFDGHTYLTDLADAALKEGRRGSP